MDPINAAVAAIDSLKPGEDFTYAGIAKIRGVERSTLSRRHRRVTRAREVTSQNRQKLNQQQERELLRYIERLTERGLPPTRQMIGNFAACIAKEDVSMSWVDRFVKRYPEALIRSWSTGLDRNRHNADSEAKYKLYFQLLHEKIEKYRVEPQHTYNMDEKGFLLGITGRSKRVFNRPLYMSRQVRQALQDGSREWISTLACICADGSTVDQALVYKSDAETLQSSWVEEIDGNHHRAFITSSTSGWSNNQIGIGWLVQVFDRCTKEKAQRSYRLLIVDGHGSHLTMDFIDYCDRNRILLAIFPPHSTHTLQPLDVCIFKSLSAAYSNELTKHLHNSQGLSTVAKRDFFSLFWKAWVTTATPQLIKRAFECTGIWPPDSSTILKRFSQNTQQENNSRESSTSVLSASDWRKIERLLRSTVRDIATEESRKLSQTIHSISVQKQLLEHENQGLREALANKKRRQTKGRTLPFEQPDEWHGGAVFWSPARVQRARDALAQQEAEKQQQQHQKKEQREIQKANQQLKAQLLQEKRVARAVAQEARARERAENATARRLYQQARKAQIQHQKRIKLSEKGNRKASVSTSRPIKKNKSVREAEEGGAATPAAPALSSRRGRIIKTPTRYL
jgi:hypothetical protein